MATTASEARRSLFRLIEKVNDDRTAVEITSKRGNAILMSAADYEAWQETAYLFRSNSPPPRERWRRRCALGG